MKTEKMKFKVKPCLPGVLHLEFNSRLGLNLTMCRMQEYFESPYDEVRCRNISLIEFIQYYAKEDGTMDYWSYWEGINIPKKYVDEFFMAHKFAASLNVLELSVEKRWEDTDYQYLIATEVNSPPSVLDHELAHARYALDPVYKEAARKFILGMGTTVLNKLFESLTANERYMTDGEHLIDEVQAYLISSDVKELAETFETIELPVLCSLQHQLRKAVNAAL
jgi:hypothetical protein